MQMKLLVLIHRQRNIKENFQNRKFLRIRMDAMAMDILM